MRCGLFVWKVEVSHTFHSGSIFVVHFAVHRLGVSGLRKRREQGFRGGGGGCDLPSSDQLSSSQTHFDADLKQSKHQNANDNKYVA